MNRCVAIIHKGKIQCSRKQTILVRVKRAGSQQTEEYDTRLCYAHLKIIQHGQYWTSSKYYSASRERYYQRFKRPSILAMISDRIMRVELVSING